MANENAAQGRLKNWLDEITDIVDAVGGMELDVPPRETARDPPDFSDFPIDPRDADAANSGSRDK